MKKFIYTLILFAMLLSTKVLAVTIEQLPIRALELGSSFYISNHHIPVREGDTLTYQKGKSITKWGPDFDSNVPFCDIQSKDIYIGIESQIFNIVSVNGKLNLKGQLGEPNWSTKITFQNSEKPSAFIEMNCLRLAGGTFDEITIGQLFEILMQDFSPEEISVKSTGQRSPSIISPNYVLKFIDLNNNNIFESRKKINLKQVDEGYFQTFIQDSKSSFEEIDFKRNFCTLFLLDESNKILDENIELPKGFRFKFSELSATYEKAKTPSVLYYGYEYGGKVSGYEGEGELFLTCTSPNPNYFPYYSHLIDTLGGIISVFLDL